MASKFEVLAREDIKKALPATGQFESLHQWEGEYRVRRGTKGGRCVFTSGGRRASRGLNLYLQVLWLASR